MKTMKINWKLRLMNKATLTALALAVIAFVYEILGLIGVVPGISESDVTNIVIAVINLLMMLGIITDPTTQGLSDSSQALNYDCPNCDSTEITSDISEESREFLKDNSEEVE